MAALNPHFLVICFGTTGDVHPFMHIANTLQAMGEGLTLLCPMYPAVSRGQQGHQADGIEEKI
jgi:UDP:flavonoid glycosyltransferase YjiC (YdhE family)